MFMSSVMKNVGEVDYEKMYKQAGMKMRLFFKKYKGMTISEDGQMYKDLCEIFPELVDDDERIRKAIVWCIDTVAGELGVKEPEGLSVSKLKSWLEKHKRVMWSEDDESMLNEIVLDLKLLQSKDSGAEGKEAYQREIDWIQNLRPQSKQLIWSEEDERIRQDIENLIHFALEDGSAVSPAAKTTKEQALEWLQSLMPKNCFKPSEEQLDALETAVSACQSNTLAGLYNTLKSL